jgi:hypothetical protein
LTVDQVVLAPVWTFLWTDEVPTLWTLLGGGVLLAAIVWLTVHPHHVPHTADDTAVTAAAAARDKGAHSAAVTNPVGAVELVERPHEEASSV